MAFQQYQQQQQQPPPLIDINNLDENFEIRFDYDQKGNLTRVRKQRRSGGGCAQVFLFLFLLTAGAVVLSYLSKQ